MKLILLLALFCQVSYGNLPKSFLVEGKKAVFVDFQTADYKITYDRENESAWAQARIKFLALEAGYPLFDSVEAPTFISLNGKSIQAKEIQTPSNEATLRMMNERILPGEHEAVIKVPLKALVSFTSEGVKSAFWTSDLSRRNFLERYLPANLEFDQVEMSFLVEFKGEASNQRIYTNGVVKEVKSQEGRSFKITYPAYYNASSIFFHTVPQGEMEEISFSLKSLDGREVPVLIYKARSLWRGGSVLERLKRETTKIFHELESDYGAWPHPEILIYNAGLGGMEYHGATMTSSQALGHELFHCYFARGVMPANGNAGWIDEALASWRDGGYRTLTFLSGRSGMSSHPYYTRTTDREAYTFGQRFMAYMDGKLKSEGGLKPFLRHLAFTKMFSVIRINEFIQDMSLFYGVSVEEDFKQYTFGGQGPFKSAPIDNHPIHHKMTLEELKNYL